MSTAFAFAYLAFIKDPGLVTLTPPQAALRKEAEERPWFLVEWIRSGIVNKKGAIRLSVVRFAAGILTLPFPSMAAPTQEATASSVAFEWPTPAPISAEIELQRVVHQAQIEVVKQELVESAKYKRPSEDEALFWVAGVGLILVWLFGVPTQIVETTTTTLSERVIACNEIGPQKSARRRKTTATNLHHP